MRLLVINPNTTRAMTAKIATAARRVARPGTEIIATQPDIGPESIQGFLDVARSQQGLLEVARRHPDVDAVVVACFDDTGVDALLGLEAEFAKVLPEAVSPGVMIDFDSTYSPSGTGTINRSETLSLTFAAVVTQILPNGSLVIVRRQEILVNSEVRELMVTGVIRPSDIDSDNTISDDNIAEMRVAYGGSGTLSQLQQPRWGTQIWDIIFPF